VLASAARIKLASDSAIDCSERRMTSTFLSIDRARGLAQSAFRGGLSRRDTVHRRSSASRHGQEMDKSAFSPIRHSPKSLPELVELTGIEPVTS
jgi:hypothetical protein